MSTVIVLKPPFELQVQPFLEFSGLTILVFDYCINISAEVMWMWNTKWTLVRILFSLARYVPFILVPVSSYYALGTDFATKCSRWSGAATGMIIISMMAAEGLLFIRTWVLWSRRRIVLLGLIALGAACVGASITLGALADGSSSNDISKEEAPLFPISNCVDPLQSLTTVWNFVGLAIFEFVILILTIVQIFKYDRRSRVSAIIRNDIVYTTCILGMSVANSILLNQSPVLVLQVVIHSVFGSRLLFSLRQIMHQQHIMSISAAAQSTFRNVDEMPPMIFAEDAGTSSSSVGVEYER